MVASAASYVVFPAALGKLAVDPERSRDHLSASFLIALAARMLREIGDLWRVSKKEQKRLATLSIDAVISFKSPSERASFTADLTRAVAALVERYHDESAPQGRPHRLTIASYPAPGKADNEKGEENANQE